MNVGLILDAVSSIAPNGAAPSDMLLARKVAAATSSDGREAHRLVECDEILNGC